MVNISTDNLTVSTKLTLSPGAAVSGLTVEHVQGLQKGLERKPNSHSPAFTGVPTAPTATSGTNTTQIATTEFVKTALDNLSGTAPALLNTLSELATALDNDANFATTVTTSLDAKAPLVSPGLTGTPTAPTATAGTNSTQIATTEFVTSAVSAETTNRTAAISAETSARTTAISDETSARTNALATKVGLTGNETIEGTKTFSSPIVGSINGNASTATTLQTARNIAGQSFNGSADITISYLNLSDGSSLATSTYVNNVGNTKVSLTGNETIAGTKTFSSPIVGSINGNASTATTLQTARTIAGKSFNGSTDIAISYLDLSDGSNLATSTYVNNVGNAKVALTGNQTIEGTKTFSSTIGGSISGNATTATTLETARTIAGKPFDGSQDVTIASSDLSDASSVASKTYVDGKISDLLGADVPAALNTLKEFATALNDDADFAGTVTTLLDAKAPSASPSFTGNVNFGTSNVIGLTKAMVGLDNVDNTSDAAKVTSGAIKDALNLKANLTLLTSNYVAIGSTAGQTLQGGYAVAIGNAAGQDTQSDSAVAIGNAAGTLVQGENAVAIGNSAGTNAQGGYAVAIGFNAGKTAQGNYAVAIGNRAGEENQSAGSIAINASSSSALNPAAAGLFVHPIRTTGDAITTYLAYDTTNKEIQYKTLDATAVGITIHTVNSNTYLKVDVGGGSVYWFGPSVQSPI